MKRFFTTAAAVAAVSISLTSCASGQQAVSPVNADGSCSTTEEFTIIGIGMYADAVPLLAEQQDILADHCLSIIQNTVDNPAASIAALVGGSADIVYVPSVPLINAVAKGLDLKAVAPSDGHSPNAESLPPEQADQTGVYVASGSNITRAQDLEGKTVSVPARNAQVEITIAGTVLQDGGDPSKVKWSQLDFPTAVDQLNNGSLDAAGLVAPFTDLANSKGNERILSPAVSFFGPGTTVGVWTTTGATLEKKEEAMKRFREAMIEANAYTMDHPDEFVDAVAEQTKVPAEEVRESESGYYFGDDVTLDDLEGPMDQMVELGYLEEPPDLDALFLMW